MEIKIFDSILHGELKPWTLDTTDTRRFTTLIRKAGEVTPSTNAEIQNQLAGLLQDFPILHKWISEQDLSNNTLQPLICTVQLPDSAGPVTRFYTAIISAETIRVYNAFIHYPADWNKEIDIPFQTGRILNSLKVLTQQTVTELQERGFTTIPDEQSNFIHFTLYYLQHSLIQLYFAIQKTFEKNLQQVTTLEDFYSLDLGLQKSQIIALNYPGIPQQKEITSIAQSDNKPFSFGFKGDEAKLRNLISVMCTHKNLFDEAVTKPDDFIKLLTTKNINDRQYKIQIGCESNLFQYIADKLKVTSPKFNYANIGRCKYFFSKNGKLIRASLFSNSKSNNPVSKQLKEEIDRYFKENDM